MGEPRHLHRPRRYVTGRGLIALAALTASAVLLGACSSSGVATSQGATPPGSGATGGTAAAGAAGTSVPGGSPPSAGAATPTKATGAAVPSPGCGTSKAPAAELEQHDLTVAGADRFYLLTTPPQHNGTTPLPLVVDFHGLSEGARVHATMSQFSPLAQKEGFVVAFPNGTGTPVRWDANPSSNPNNDLTYVDQMLSQIEASHCIDTSRVYATGLSYGAIMSSFLTCTRSTTFAAVAPVAGITIPTTCNPTRPMPALTFHGTADPILLFNGGVADLSGLLSGQSKDASVPDPAAPKADLNGPGYPEAAKTWAVRNGCKPEPTDTEVSDTVIHRVYACPAGADVEFYIVEGGGHSWPGSEFSKSIGKIVGPTTFDIDATALAWAFFQRFQLPAGH